MKVSHFHFRKVPLKLKPCCFFCSNWLDPLTDIQEDEDEEFSTSLSVGDGRFLVDLGKYVDVNPVWGNGVFRLVLLSLFLLLTYISSFNITSSMIWCSEHNEIETHSSSSPD